MENLSKKKCGSCANGVSPYTPEQIQPLLAQVPGWELVQGPPRIRREVKFKDFKEAIAFVNRLAKLAEKEGHHPNILIHGWNRVQIELYTHKIGGLHENDFILAAKINEKI